MKTLKLNKEDIEEAKLLLTGAENTVDLPTMFFKAAEILSIDPVDSDKLIRAFAGHYTVIAKEDEVVCGLASMDKEGNIGMLYVSADEDYKKTSTALLRALERNALKKELQTLSALSTERSESVLKKFGFEIYDSQGGGESFMVKEIQDKSQAEFSSDSVKRFKLDPSKPISTEGELTGWPILFLIVTSFIAAVFFVISIVNLKNSDGGLANNYKIAIAAVSILWLISLSFFIVYFVRKSKLKKEILSMGVTNAVIVSDVVCERMEYRNNNDSEDRKIYERCAFTYMYYDDDMKRHTVNFDRKYRTKAEFFYKGQELIVAYSKDKCYLLKKYSFVGDQSLLDLPEDKNLDTEDIADGLQAKEVPHKNLVPIAAQTRSYLYPISAYAVAAIIAVTVLSLNFIIAKQSGVSYGKTSYLIWVFMAIGVSIFAGVGTYFIIPPLKAVGKYKKICKGGAKYVKGKLKTNSKTYSSDNENSFYCVYKTLSGEIKHVKVGGSYVRERMQKGDCDVTVAYDGSNAIALVEKESLAESLKSQKRHDKWNKGSW